MFDPYNDSNTDDLFTVANLNSFLSPLEILRDILGFFFSLFYHENVWFVNSLGSSHCGDSSVYSQHTIIV